MKKDCLFLWLALSVGVVTAKCTGGKFGANCKLDCHCKNGNSCNSTTGSCAQFGRCAAGWFSATGKDNCQKECKRGKFGANCKLDCHCKIDNSCDPTTGSCAHIGGCHSMWFSECEMDNCQKQCTAGKFGANCSLSCHCRKSKSCIKTTGSCAPFGGCDEGWSSAAGRSNCQKQCTAGKFGANCKLDCHCKNGNSCNPSTGSCAQFGGCHGKWSNDDGKDNCQHPRNCRHYPRLKCAHPYQFCDYFNCDKDASGNVVQRRCHKVFRVQWRDPYTGKILTPPAPKPKCRYR